MLKRKWLQAVPLVIGLLLMRTPTAVAQERVTFPSADGRTELVGYLFVPDKRAARVPAVVMMHGRAGVYSSAARGRYDATTITQRHRMWATSWVGQGYAALLVDSFAPRGYPQGFPIHSIQSRPDAVNEVTTRPLDAYGALTWLRARDDIAGDRVGLQGWSNGGSAALVAMATGSGFAPATSRKGFAAALVFYPGCGLRGRFAKEAYRPYAPVRVFQGTDDQEVSYQQCRTLVERSRKVDGDIDLTLYPGANHGFDDPGRARQAITANVTAKADATARALALFAQQLAPPPAKP